MKMTFGGDSDSDCNVHCKSERRYQQVEESPSCRGSTLP